MRKFLSNNIYQNLSVLDKSIFKFYKRDWSDNRVGHLVHGGPAATRHTYTLTVGGHIHMLAVTSKTSSRSLILTNMQVMLK